MCITYMTYIANTEHTVTHSHVTSMRNQEGTQTATSVLSVVGSHNGLEFRADSVDGLNGLRV